jgi:hypothetical protein
MDSSIEFLLKNDVPQPEVATIYPLVPASSATIDDDKIGFTLDVAARLDRESDEVSQRAVVIPIGEPTPPKLADSA